MAYHNNYAKQDWPHLAYPDGEDLNDIGKTAVDWSHGMTEPIVPGTRTVSAGNQNLGGLYKLTFSEGGSIDGDQEIKINTKLRFQSLVPFTDVDASVTFDDLGAPGTGNGGHLVFRGIATPGGSLITLAGIKASQVNSSGDGASYLDFYTRESFTSELTLHYRITNDGKHLFNTTTDEPC